MKRRFLLTGYALGGLASLFGVARALAEPPKSEGSSRAGSFPDVLVQDQEGKTHRFYDDLIKGKIVVINFMYTQCDGI